MDVETASALERIGARLDALDTSLGAKIVAFRDELRQESAARRDDLRREIAALRDSVEEVRRHAVILNESTREDIRFVAEAVAGLSIKIDSLRR
jgi:DNA-binding IclR family transcriptional regulator